MNFFLHRLYRRYVQGNSAEDIEEKIYRFDQLNPARQQKERAEKLLSLLKKANQEVPYYRDLFDLRKLSFTDEVSLNGFKEIPILTKKDIRNNFEKFKNIQTPNIRYFKNRTSGSTGSPFSFLVDIDYLSIKHGLLNYQLKTNGRRLEDTLIKLWVTYADADGVSNRIKQRIGDFLTNRFTIDTHNMNDEIMASIVRKINAQRSVYIEAYAQSAYELARYINQNSIPIHNVRAVTTSVSTLFDFMRREIEKAFNCRLYNRYGSREASVIAFEREDKAGLWVSAYQYIVEVVDSRGQHCQPGEEGDVVITSFSNFVFPFIRYRIGDRAVAGELEEYPVLSCRSLNSITGRISDKILRRDGSFVDSSFFSILIGHHLNSGWIEKMQFIQVNYDLIHINIIRTDDTFLPIDEIDRLSKAIRKEMGEQCQVRVNFVKEIEPLKSGKFQYVVSLINQEQ